MVTRCLIMTALEADYPKNESILFLGEWCKSYKKKFFLENLDYSVVPYHWNDREKLYQDYLYLKTLYEDLLKDIVVQLNDLHDVNHSVRYWRIIIGPWLSGFTQMLFDRWYMLTYAFSKNNISLVYSMNHFKKLFIPQNMMEFIEFFKKDPWNDFIYTQILDWMKIPTKKIDCAKQIQNKKEKYVILKRNFKNNLAKSINIVCGTFCKKNEYFFISSYLNLTQDFLLQIKLGQIPKLWKSVSIPENKLNSELRKWNISKSEDTDSFSNLIRSFIPRHIPIAYIENYKKIISLSKKVNWPKNPKLVFTSNAFFSDDLFKIWIADKSEQGTPFLIGQHGGNYGIASWSSLEEHELSIADHFLSWGWKHSNHTNILPIGNLKRFGKNIKPCQTGKALLIEMALPRQSYYLYSIPIATDQWISYFQEQCKFIKALPTFLQKEVLVRLFPEDFEHYQEQRWKETFQSIQIDTGSQSMFSLLKETKLCISTYNATTYLEFLSLNIPTIIFWNPKYWEIRNSAIPYFEKLKEVGIFHETPESAAKQMIKIWDDILIWWENPRLQLIRQDFCRNYAYSPKNPLDAMKKIFYSIANK